MPDEQSKPEQSLTPQQHQREPDNPGAALPSQPQPTEQTPIIEAVRIDEPDISSPELSIETFSITETFYTGPLPPPELLASYEKVHPGLADRLVKMVEEELKHRHEHESRALTAEINDDKENRIERRQGQNYALIMGLTGICVAGIVSIWSPTTACVIGGTSVVGLVTAFLVGTKQSDEGPLTSGELDKAAKK